ncbi:MAG: alcohol dehydrogenase catalytic domain-containing protein [Dehalococcoidia bacterium]
MRALVFHEPGKIAVESIPDPAVGPGEALLRVGAAGVCASDLRVFRGEKYAAPGVVPGHEFAGAVVERGRDVDNLDIGDRVAVYPIIACGRCHFCRRGLRNRCVRRETLGYDRNGGLAEFVLLPAAIVRQGQAMPLPDGLPFERGSMTEPTACVLNSLEACRLRAGASLAVLGAGPMGLLHLVLARALGAGPIVVAEPVASRRALAADLGATAVTGADPDEVKSAVHDATHGHGADVVIVSVGLAGLAETALQLAAKQASINLFAGFPPQTTAALDVNYLHYNEIALLGTQNATPDQFLRTTALLPSLPALDRLITHRFDMAEAVQSYAVRDQPSALKTVVLPHPGSEQAKSRSAKGGA